MFEPLAGLFETRLKAQQMQAMQCQVWVEQTGAWTSHQPNGDHLGDFNDDDAGVNEDGDDDDNDVDDVCDNDVDDVGDNDVNDVGDNDVADVGVNDNDDQLNPGQVCSSLCHSAPWAKKTSAAIFFNVLPFEWW